MAAPQIIDASTQQTCNLHTLIAKSQFCWNLQNAGFSQSCHIIVLTVISISSTIICHHHHYYHHYSQIFHYHLSTTSTILLVTITCHHYYHLYHYYLLSSLLSRHLWGKVVGETANANILKVFYCTIIKGYLCCQFVMQVSPLNYTGNRASFKLFQSHLVCKIILVCFCIDKNFKATHTHTHTQLLSSLSFSAHCSLQENF